MERLLLGDQRIVEVIVVKYRSGKMGGMVCDFWDGVGWTSS